MWQAAWFAADSEVGRNRQFRGLSFPSNTSASISQYRPQTLLLRTRTGSRKQSCS